MLWNIQQGAVELGWDFYGPIIAMVALIALGVPVWASIGVGAVSMLYFSDVLPLTCRGKPVWRH